MSLYIHKMATFGINVFVLLSVFAIFATTLMANIDDDVYWQKRQEEAYNIAQKTYEPDVFNVTNTLNHEVHRTLMDIKPHVLRNNTRRGLRGNPKHWGPCMVTNPIDRCWRCQSNWHLNRKRLADCGLGFGYKTTGGKAGIFYVVTDNSDDISNPKPGTLRWGVIQKEPLWIIFERSMNIRLVQELMVQSDKTIDGRGVHVNIVNGAGITIQFQHNVIIHGIHVRNIVPGNGGLIRDAVDHIGERTQSDGDGISLFGATNVWIDHVSMSNCKDGLIDIIEASTGITISNSHFTDHNEVMLFGARDNTPKDKIMQVTVAFNHFGKRLVQRMPRCRYGFVHVVNNDYTHWMMYAIGGSSNPTIISQGNRFIAPNDPNAKEITHRVAENWEWQNWTWISDGDLMMNGAFFVPSGDQSGPQKYLSQFEQKAAIPAAKGTEVTTITKFAGALACVPGRPC